MDAAVSAREDRGQLTGSMGAGQVYGFNLPVPTIATSLHLMQRRRRTKRAGGR